MWRRWQSNLQKFSAVRRRKRERLGQFDLNYAMVSGQSPLTVHSSLCQIPHLHQPLKVLI